MIKRSEQIKRLRTAVESRLKEFYYMCCINFERKAEVTQHSDLEDASALFYEAFNQLKKDLKKVSRTTRSKLTKVIDILEQIESKNNEN